MTLSLNSISIGSCALPGQVKISESAWQLAQQSSASFVGQNSKSQQHIIGFYWSTGGTIQRSQDAPKEPLPAGLNLGFYRRDQIHPEAIHSHNGIDCVVVIPADVLERASHRMIDAHDQAWGRVSLL